MADREFSINPASAMSSRRKLLQERLPQGQNAPQKHPLGLYTEQFSGTPFTAPRAVNRRTWTYRIRPSVTHRPYEEIPAGLMRSGPFHEVAHHAESAALGSAAASPKRRPTSSTAS